MGLAGWDFPLYSGIMSKTELQRKIQEALKATPQADKVRRVRLFGSHLHGDATEQSDIDLLIDFDESVSVGYFEIVRLQDALEQALEKKVDIVTPRALSKHFREDVMQEAELVYEK